MPYLLVRHKVRDFAKWKTVFDSHADAQRRCGLTVRHVLRNADDHPEVFLFFDAETIAGAKDFVFAPQVPAAQQDSGVLDKPDIWFLE